MVYECGVCVCMVHVCVVSVHVCCVCVVHSMYGMSGGDWGEDWDEGWGEEINSKNAKRMWRSKVSFWELFSPSSVVPGTKLSLESQFLYLLSRLVPLSLTLSYAAFCFLLLLPVIKIYVSEMLRYFVKYMIQHAIKQNLMVANKYIF